jgi:hypothetical protein
MADGTKSSDMESLGKKRKVGSSTAAAGKRRTGLANTNHTAAK